MQVRFVLGGFLGLFLQAGADSPAYSHVGALQKSTYRISEGNGTYFFRTSVDFRPMQTGEAWISSPAGIRLTRLRLNRTFRHAWGSNRERVKQVGRCREDRARHSLLKFPVRLSH